MSFSRAMDILHLVVDLALVMPGYLIECSIGRSTGLFLRPARLPHGRGSPAKAGAKQIGGHRCGVIDHFASDSVVASRGDAFIHMPSTTTYWNTDSAGHRTDRNGPISVLLSSGKGVASRARNWTCGGGRPFSMRRTVVERNGALEIVDESMASDNGPTTSQNDRARRAKRR